MTKTSNKHGYFFSADAFIALLIIISVILFIKPPIIQISNEENMHKDLLVALSALEIGELNNSYAQQLIADGDVANLNNSVLEQIGEFYALSDPKAQSLADSIFDDLNLSKNVGLYFDSNLISSSGSVDFSDAESISTARQIISGIQQGPSVKGYSARAFLFAEKKVDYFYFGGYVGDGNLTIYLGENVASANIEGAFSGDFSLYINNQLVGNYSPPKDIPYKISLADHTNKFVSGSNYLDFKHGNNLYVAGGYVRVTYNSTDIPVSNERDYFPGISGLINLYQGFYVPDNIYTMDICLHYNSSYDIFLTIGNTTVLEENSSGLEVVRCLDDRFLSELFGMNYNQFANKTVPLRLGLKNVSYVQNITLPVDVFSVNDLSGSMAPACYGAGFWCCFAAGGCNTRAKCNSCGGAWEDKIGEAKNATKLFIDIVLNSSLNRVGLQGYKTSASSTDYYPLSNNSVSLKNEVTSWTAGGTTCVCCGINKAVNDIVANSSSNKSRSLVVMSDGIANVLCAQQGTGNAKRDAIKAACDAYNNYGIVTHAIGFGSDVDEQTLLNVSVCGHGNYYFANVGELEDKFNDIAQDVITAAYQEQTITGEGIYTRLYPDSYIHIGYDLNVPFGLIVKSETDIFNNNISQGSFNISNDAIPYETKIVSYSGSKWTSKAEIYNPATSLWESIYDLKDFGLNFTSLGDPYFVNIPINKVFQGNNTARIFTGLVAGNYSGGSSYNKIIYSVVKDFPQYSYIVPSADGCIWNIMFEDETNSSIKVPSNYSGTDTCSYSPGNIFYNNDDALELAVFNLLSELDLNSNEKVEAKFVENDLSLDTTQVEGIPFTWDTEVQVRIWR